MAKNKPLRMCVSCRETFPKEDVLRIVRNKDGEIFIDETGKGAGRGAYICKNKECFEKAKKSKALGRAFKCEIDDAIYLKIEEYLNREGW